MNSLDYLFADNTRWAEDIKKEDPEFFNKLAQQQKPEFLWIGCADSRVPANEIVGLLPGELFVHRNVANLVIQTDLNCLSVLQYAVEYLQVKHIIVTGHYGCGGVKAAMETKQLGMIDYWVRSIRDVYFNHQEEMQSICDEAERIDRLCELNVEQQVANVAHTNIVQNAWKRGQSVTIHGWVYSICDGIIRQITTPIKSIEQVTERYRMA